MKNLAGLALLGVGILVALPLHAANGVHAISGAGSSAAAPVYRVWAQAYATRGGDGVAYDAVGSGAGMERIRKREADFGASDVIAPTADLQKDGLVMFPTVISGVVPVVNLPKSATAIRLTGELLAKIYLAEITSWNAPEIVALNSGVALPNQPIRVVCRSDGSGTTYNFTDYLSKLSPAWKAKYGVASKHPWPASFIAVKGSSAVSQAVRANTGAIGYIDYNYVVDDELTDVQMRNAAGKYIAASTGSFRSAVFQSDWYRKGQFSGTLTNLDGESSWPITMGTYVALPKVATDNTQSLRALRFFTWAFANGDALAGLAKFVPLPEKVQASAFREIVSVVGQNGESIGLDSLKVLLGGVR